MGNREDLLTGAEECLYEKGYARTTARDIASRSGVSLAGIGYHFGSKEALLKEALREALEKWGNEVGAIMTSDFPTDRTADRFAAIWSKAIESFQRSAKLWAVQFELLAILEREPDLRMSFAEDTRQARIALADMFGVVTEDDDEAIKVGALYQALLGGLAAQYLGDPESVPSGADLLEAVRLIAPDLMPPRD
ncbi:MAG: TetR family transcriptional regulator [Actinophytocola sp.]|uniref:TetR/AcrR family transcriptional regulator n=1 Tax=Actinophytocola sp. TaxID=1872138 RepID=UPI00132B76D1|nr:TetR/AcrR family transcriptional regulator [Actinophytocola sp.]MPZ84662.1 TetR family transcriptional regulator [Actinophytocola sp.]